MINIRDIVKIRELFPDEELYYIRISELDFVVKVITPSEYNTILDLSNTEEDKEDLVMQTALVYPSNYNVPLGDAGIPKQISELVLKFSLLHKESRPLIIDRMNHYMELLDYSKNGDIDVYLPVVIKAAFPEYTFDQIDTWSIDLRLKNLARAILCLELKGVKGLRTFIEDEVPTKEVTMEEEIKYYEEVGIDPMLPIYDKYKTNVNLIESPFIANQCWRNDEVLNEIRQKLHKRKR